MLISFTLDSFRLAFLIGVHTSKYMFVVCFIFRELSGLVFGFGFDFHIVHLWVGG